ncbi:Molybdenum cofactor guanylyltransferase [hydrothermal vent metagenome]|uniref:Molybdenum cofactor guanylyltransferase n=1 Tax=hydrothermal vent metagenome TaxID=652676 RepID=A0A3B0RI89_9ZZZZ
MNSNITCVILAGGLARRMGNIDKAFVELDSKPMLTHVIDRIAPQNPSIIINANGDPARFANWQLPVIADTIDGFPGPLAGVLAAMEWAKEHRPEKQWPEKQWIVSIPVDTPFTPDDLVARFAAAIKENQADLACAKTNGRAHPVVGMWPVALADNLRQAMTHENIRKVDLWTARFKLVQVEFETEPVDPFFNINRPQDIEKAEQILQGKT